MKKILVAVICMVSVIAGSSASVNNNDLETILNSAIKGTIVVVRQDYQLVDEDEDEIKNALDKEYWGRGYSLGLRVGDHSFLVSGEAMRPWSRENFSKNDSFQPVISHTSVRDIEAPEFEPLDFNSDEATEVCESRLYTVEGSEEPGLSLCGLTGLLKGYAVWATPTKPIKEGDDNQMFKIDLVPMSFRLTDSKSLNDIPEVPNANTFGGFFLVPLVIRPGMVDFCVVGQFQKVGGIWKLVSVDNGSEVRATATSINNSGSKWLDDIADGMCSGISAFLGL